MQNIAPCPLVVKPPIDGNGRANGNKPIGHFRSKFPSTQSPKRPRRFRPYTPKPLVSLSVAFDRAGYRSAR
jgi:hypothetical protein